MDSFRNFVYVSNYVHLKSFAWKRDCPISSKLQTSQIWPRSFNKALIDSTSYIQMENTKATGLLFKGSWILTNFWHSSWHYFGYISGKIAKPHILESPQKSLKTHQHSKRYRGQLLLKLRAVEVATSFHWISSRST